MSAPQLDAEPFEFTAPLSVCIDLNQPAAWLALRPVLTLARELDITVDWLPFPAAPPKPAPAAGADDSRGARHRRARASYQLRELRRYAAVQGLTPGELYRDGDTTAALLGLLWARRRAPERVADYLLRLFDDYWQGTAAEVDGAAVARLLDGCGVATGSAAGAAGGFAEYAGGEGAVELDDLRARLVAAGIFTVPSLVVEQEVYVGRAHLPLLRWILQGRVGPPPL